MNTLVVVVTIVTNTQTSGYIATNKVIGVIAQIRVRPLRHKAGIQSNRRAIDDLVVIKGHVVQLIVGLVSKRLRLNFHPDGRRTRTRRIALVIGHEPNALVPVDKGVVSTIRRIGAVTIRVHIRGHVRVLSGSQITADRPLSNNLRYHIIGVGRRNRVDMVLDLTTIQLPMFVPDLALVVGNGRIHQRQRTRPPAGTQNRRLTIGLGCNFEQTVGINPPYPNGTSKKRMLFGGRWIIQLWDFVACVTASSLVPPIVVTSQNHRTDIVNVQVDPGSGRIASGCNPCNKLTGISLGPCGNIESFPSLGTP